MKTVVALVCSLLLSGLLAAQAVTARLANVIKLLENDSQMRHAIIGFYAVDQRTGKVIYSRNGETGLAVASSQKVITSAATLELLGTNYRYKTVLSYTGEITNSILNGDVYLTGSGDPTLGSWRYESTKEQAVLNEWTMALKDAGIQKVSGMIKDTGSFESQTIPGGWIWDDIGNYYGAGVAALNWRENQYDLNLRPSHREGEKVAILSNVPPLYNATLTNELVTGNPGSGDNGYIYLPPYSIAGFVRGTVPPGQRFTISGSFPNPPLQLVETVKEELLKQGIQINSPAPNQQPASQLTVLHTHWSPTLDSMNYWFLKKSINLYGEAFVKTLALEKKGFGSEEAGLSVITDFWKRQGVEETSLNIIDGSGLSPQNRVTAKALVQVMQYARQRPWFQSFYNALPEINGVKMKSGVIGGARSFTGYNGSYTFAIIVNNFNGSPAAIVQKMYAIIDLLK